MAAFLGAHRDGVPVALATSGTAAGPRSVVRTTASWVGSFPTVARLSGLDGSSRLWLPGPLGSTMNLFAAVHATTLGAPLVATPAEASHAVLTPAALAALLDGDAPAGLTVVVAGDRLSRAAARPGRGGRGWWCTTTTAPRSCRSSRGARTPTT